MERRQHLVFPIAQHDRRHRTANARPCCTRKHPLNPHSVDLPPTLQNSTAAPFVGDQRPLGAYISDGVPCPVPILSKNLRCNISQIAAGSLRPGIQSPAIHTKFRISCKRPDHGDGIDYLVVTSLIAVTRTPYHSSCARPPTQYSRHTPVGPSEPHGYAHPTIPQRTMGAAGPHTLDTTRSRTVLPTTTHRC